MFVIPENEFSAVTNSKQSLKKQSLVYIPLLVIPQDQCFDSFVKPQGETSTA